jgi:hypothetical protein
MMRLTQSPGSPSSASHTAQGFPLPCCLRQTAQPAQTCWCRPPGSWGRLLCVSAGRVRRTRSPWNVSRSAPVRDQAATPPPGPDLRKRVRGRRAPRVSQAAVPRRTGYRSRRGERCTPRWWARRGSLCARSAVAAGAAASGGDAPGRRGDGPHDALRRCVPRELLEEAGGVVLRTAHHDACSRPRRRARPHHECLLDDGHQRAAIVAADGGA